MTGLGFTVSDNAFAQQSYESRRERTKFADLTRKIARYDSLGLEPKGRAELLNNYPDNEASQRLFSWTRQYDKEIKGEEQTYFPGTVTSFLVSFPFECASMYDFVQPLEPETEGFDTSKPQAGAMFPALNWMQYDSIGHSGAVLPNERMANDGYVTMYLASRLMWTSEKKPTDAILEIPSSTPVIAWLNGKRVVETLDKGPSPAPLFGTRYRIKLNPGENILVIKVAALEETPAFYVFIRDAKSGMPFEIKVDNSSPIVSGKLETELSAKSEPSIIRQIIEDETIPVVNRALIAKQGLNSEEAGRVINGLLMTDIDKTAALPVDDLEIAMLAIDDPAKGMVILNKANAKYQGNAKFDLLYARQMILASEAQGDRGSRFADEWPEIQKRIGSQPPSDEYAILHTKIRALAEFNNDQTMTAYKDFIQGKCDGDCKNTMMPMVVGEMHQSAATTQYRKSIGELYENQKNASAYLVDMLDMDLKRAVANGDERELARTLAKTQHEVEAFFKLHPYDDFMWDFWLDVVSVYGVDQVQSKPERLVVYNEAGFTADADSWYMLYLSQRMNSPQRWLKYARHCMRTNQIAEVAEAYEMASNLMPQNDEIPEQAAMYRFISNQQSADAADASFETPFIVKDIPGNHSKDAVGVVSLLDNRVVRILPNGLSSTFNQVAFEILDEQGLKSMRAMPINYSPTDEKVEIISVTTTKKDGSVRRLYNTSEYTMADESIKMYYDMRQLVIEVPDLAVGDRVEYRFKRTQTQRASSSVSFFGDVYYLQNQFVKQWSKYTVIAPESIHIQMIRHSPDGTVSSPAQSVTNNGITTMSFEEKDMPRFIDETNMPGTTETKPVLFITSFDSWQQLADWYIDLASPQWKIDDAIRAKVKELTDGVTDPLQKVKNIYHFVVKSTRYVALEFGIHGHKPYPVSQIYERRFGDCKDKASLLKVMLTEAGIPTDFVLVRTRSNGDMNMKSANPYLFDHAIAYVPQFDLYLDGTAEFSGTSELPVMDQDAWTFIVKSDGSYKLQKAPLSKADDNRSQHTWVYDLTKGAQVPYTDEVEYTGFIASAYREQYQIENLQRENLEHEMSSSVPGTHVNNVKFSDLTDLEAPVRYTMQATTSFSDIVKTEGKTWLVHPIVSTSRTVQRFASSTSRRLPLILMAPLSFVHRVTLVLPPGAKVVLPDNISESGAFGHFDIRARFENNQIITDVSLALTQTHISTSDYDDFQDFLQRFDRRLNLPYTIELP